MATPTHTLTVQLYRHPDKPPATAEDTKKATDRITNELQELGFEVTETPTLADAE